MTEYLVPAGQALYELIMGKLGAEYTDGKAKYDPLELLNMVEALIKINLNGNPVFVSLKDGYVYVSLSAVGGDNFKASLKNIIDQIKRRRAAVQARLRRAKATAKKITRKPITCLSTRFCKIFCQAQASTIRDLTLLLLPT